MYGQHSEVIGIGGDPDLALSCQDLAPAPYGMYGGTGGFLKDSNEIVICGGYNRFGKSLSSCWAVGKEDFDKHMSYPRNYASGIVIENNNLVSKIP